MRPDRDSRLAPTQALPADPSGSNTAAGLEAAVSPRAADPARAGLARYRDLVEINRGGMGAILVGTDPDIQRDVAIKVLSRAADPDDADARRFVTEGQITGQLEHPNIVPLHELGHTPRGEPYLAMKLVRGASLSSVLAESRTDPVSWPLARLLGVLAKVCDAVAFAHSRGIVHRDLKPDNVMIGEFGEVLVMDWGLAKRLGEPDLASAASVAAAASASKTLAGSILGTPAYMPPEQAEGRIEAIDARSDVYALGAVLYEILTLTPPYEGRTPIAIIDQVVEGPPQAPSKRAPRRAIPHALEAVALTAMSRDPEGRYPDVRTLQREITAFLEDRPVAAARYSATERAARFVRHHSLATLACGLILLFGTVAATLHGRAQRAEIRFLAQRSEIERAHLLAMAQEGRIDELIGELGGRRRAERDRAIAAFHSAHQRALATGLSEDEFVRQVGQEELVKVEEALDRLFAARAQYGDRIEVTAADWFYRGMLRQSRHELPGAIADYGRALELEPNHVGALGNRGAARGALGDVDGAIADADRALQLRPDEPALLTNRGNAKMVKGDVNGAIADLEVALRLRPDYPDARSTRGAARRALGDIEGAIAECNHALRVDPRHADALLNRGLAHRDKGEVLLAIADFDRALDIRPNDLHTLMARGVARKSNGDFAGAIADFDRALAGAPDHPEVLCNRAGLHHDTGALDLALADYERALLARPAFPTALIGRGIVRLAQGQPGPAIEDFEHALRLAPTSAEALAGRGGARRAQGDVNGAMADFDRALELRPDYPDAINQRGVARAARGDLIGALADFDRAVALEPNSVRARFNRGKARRNHGDMDGAIVDLDIVLRLAPNDANALYNRGSARATRGDIPGALADFDLAIRLKPDHAFALYGRGSARAVTGDFPGALADFDLALRLSPEFPDALNSRGGVRATLGDLEGALADFDLAVKLRPALWQAGTSRAVALARLGRKSEARDAFAQALEHCPTEMRAKVEATRAQELAR